MYIKTIFQNDFFLKKLLNASLQISLMKVLKRYYPSRINVSSKEEKRENQNQSYFMVTLDFENHEKDWK